MTTTSTSASVVASAQAHASLLEDFIRLAQDKRDRQTDAFVADSLSDLIGSMQTSRDYYLVLGGAPALAMAA